MVYVPGPCGWDCLVSRGMMLAILSTLIVVATMYVFEAGDLVEIAIAAGFGYAAFAAYAFLRARMLADDPLVQLQIKARRGPTAMRIERLAAAVLIPPAVAYFIYRVALA